jgi:hypothetical protein
MAAVDIGEIESAAGDAKLGQHGLRAAFDLLDAIRKGRQVGVELRFGFQRERGEIGIDVVLDVAFEWAIGRGR